VHLPLAASQRDNFSQFAKPQAAIPKTRSPTPVGSLQYPQPRAPIILASRSPRRIELLTEAGFAFDPCQPTSTKKRTKTPSRPSSRRVSLPAESRDRCRLYRTTSCLCRRHRCRAGRCGAGQARRFRTRPLMLGQLAGSTHQVTSAVCVIHRPKRRVDVAHTTSTVAMRPRSPTREIALYVARATGAARRADTAFRITTHSSPTWRQPDNIVGLPMESPCPCSPPRNRTGNS